LDVYSWIKSLHVLAIISWMAGLLYLPRLFVYHAENRGSAEMGAQFCVMERRLYRYIMNPAMMVAWLTGLYMAWAAGFHRDVWFLVKFALVVALTLAHVYLGRRVRAFAAEQDDKSSKFYRVLNEVPTLLMIGIVVMVIVKPF
jgi:putative membrane protein